MAAGPITIREVDFSPRALMDWQCLKAPVTVVETALTAAKLFATGIRGVSADESTVEAIPVDFFDAIRVQVIANGSDTQAPVFNLYGWSDFGPGQRMGVVTMALSTMTSTASTGWHANSNTHASIRNAFAPATAWRGADTYTITSDYEFEFSCDAQAFMILGHRSINSPGTVTANATTGTATSPPVADFPSYFTVDFSRSNYKFFSVVVTNLGSATAVGAIFKPVRLKGGLTAPTGA